MPAAAALCTGCPHWPACSFGDSDGTACIWLAPIAEGLACSGVCCAALLKPCLLLCRFGDDDRFVETDPAKLARCTSDGYALDSTNRTYGAFMDDLCATVVNQPGEPWDAGLAIAWNGSQR